MLAAAQNPIILMGDGIAYSRAQEELVRVAEQLAAPVWEVNNGELNMDTTHSLFQGSTGHMFGSQSLPILKAADTVLVVGTYILPEVFPELGNVFSPDAKVIHFDLDAYEIAKNHPVTLGVVSDPKRSLCLLADCLENTLSDTQKKNAKRSLEEQRKVKAKQRAEQFAKDKEVRDANPIFMSRFMEALAPKLDENTIIFDEALTNSPPVTRYFPPQRAEQYFVTRGGSLGLGFPGAIGIKLANPDKTVLGFSGDGGCMYTIQALWTAVRHKVNAKFIVCNNLSYRLLQLNIDAYWNEQEIPQHAFPLPFDLSSPRIDFVGLAQSMGVEAVAVKTVDDIESAIEKMLSSEGPFLIDLYLENDTHPEQIPGSCSA